MEKPWLWLNEAAETIANRIVQAQPEQFTNAAAALEEARDQLLDQANRGALEVYGKWFQIQETPRFSHEDWDIISTSYWSPGYRSGNEEGDWVATVDIQWDGNMFNYEDDVVDCCGYYKLKVRSEDIDRLRPSSLGGNQQSSPKTASAAAAAKPKDPGGAPRKFRDELLFEIIRIANTPDGIPPKKSELMRRLRNFIDPNWDPNHPASESTIRGVVNEVHSSCRQKPSC
jgi:hypothetical protein